MKMMAFQEITLPVENNSLRFLYPKFAECSFTDEK